MYLELYSVYLRGGYMPEVAQHALAVVTEPGEPASAYGPGTALRGMFLRLRLRGFQGTGGLGHITFDIIVTVPRQITEAIQTLRVQGPK